MFRRDRRLQRFARDMRNDPTRAEELLWWELRGKQLGVRFRRQVPIGPFIVDFLCPPRKLVIEVDGESHESIAKDVERDRFLHERGYFVLHIDNHEVCEAMDETMDLIMRALEDPTSVEDPQNLG